MKAVLLIDSCTDLPGEYIKKNNIRYLSLTCSLDGKEYRDDFGETLGYKDFYAKVRSGKMPTTSTLNVQRFYEEFKLHVSQGNAVIYIGFSSALSGCISSANVARQQILEEYHESDISIIDSKSASLGYGMICYYAHEMLASGASKDEVVKWVEDNKLRMNHWFTVEDLFHLKRGGRVSATAAVVGTLLDVKPVLNVDDEGRLIPVTKVKGRKKSLHMLADKLQECIVNPEDQVIAISHGDCIEDVDFLVKLIKEKVTVKDIIINNIGPVIGTHSGPGTVALFFLADKR
jgi:DegV family protein with EDD domain